MGHAASPSTSSPSLGHCARYFFRTLQHPDLTFYRWSLACLLLSYALCVCIFVPRVMETNPAEAWWALQWGTPSALATLAVAISLRFIDPGTVERRRVEEGDSTTNRPTTRPSTSTMSQRTSTPSSSTPYPPPSSSSPPPLPCPYCSTVHAARTQHCRRCGVCVLRYDHHCVLIDGCIGQFNYRFFLLAVLLVSLTSAIATRLCYHLSLTLHSSFSSYHPRTLLAHATTLLFLYLTFMATFYLAFHLAGLLYAERTMKEAFGRDRAARKRGVWGCGRGKWGRVGREMWGLMVGGVRVKELREKDNRSHEQREEEEGWTDGDDADPMTGCLPEPPPHPPLHTLPGHT